MIQIKAASRLKASTNDVTIQTAQKVINWIKKATGAAGKPQNREMREVVFAVPAGKGKLSFRVGVEEETPNTLHISFESNKFHDSGASAYESGTSVDKTASAFVKELKKIVKAYGKDAARADYIVVLKELIDTPL